MCRHALVQRYFHPSSPSTSASDPVLASKVDSHATFPASNRSSPEKVICDYACDVCKYGAGELRRRKEAGLASEEWVSTQRERGRFDDGFEIE